MAHSQFINMVYLEQFGLFRVNALDYFYSSHFYDSDCNNEIIRNQGVSLDHLFNMIGWEYSLDEENIDEPHLFVIRKAYRKSPKTIEVAEVYYILNGTIYSSPNLYDLLRTRASKLSYNLKNAFSEISNHVNYDVDKGFHYNNNNNTEETTGSDSLTISDKDKDKQDVTALKRLITKAGIPDHKQLIVDVSSSAF